ncbi:MAG TPA: hypothetical protein VEW48_28450 [Thermoanaerobaculia bacterium]|nr:hypothetical protein [Thermoanaerobaculia bacterium]
MRELLRASVALALVTVLAALAGLPVCFSSACPMSPAERAACKAMGRECCQTKGGQVSHSPTMPAPVLAEAPAELSSAAPAGSGAAFSDLALPVAVPAIVQGVGLFTLHAVFLI